MAYIKPVNDYMPDDGRERRIERRQYGDDEYDVVFVKGVPGMTKVELDELRAEAAKKGEKVVDFCFCSPLNPRTYEAAPGIVCEQDVACVLRDGTTIYSDIYRPANTTEKVPVIVCWGPFGKRPSEGQDEWKLMGVPPGTVSIMSKFESADPGYWCRYGYAVANCDPRGVGNSEGDMQLWGTQDARDGYDYIEWVTSQAWCNGKATLFGNSGVCMVAWRIAAEQPPHLACLAAWEGMTDMYRESFFCGGIPNPEREAVMIHHLACKTWIEDTPTMMHRFPYFNSYWADRQTRWEKIRIPTYVTGGWVHFHLRGSLEGYRRIRTAKKWLRVHRDFEWPDSYNPNNMDELRKFYDRYCKDINNGWELTPKVRLDVMDAYTFDFMTRREEKEFPLKRTQYRQLYMDAENTEMAFEPFEKESTVVYNADTGMTEFLYRFEEDTEITGYIKLHMWVASDTYTNVDLYPWILKYSREKEYLPIEVLNAPYRGAWGWQRCSHRELDPKLSTKFQPVLAHAKEEPMTPGEPVCIDMEFFPHSRFWHKGEYLVLRMASRPIPTEWHEDFALMTHFPDNGGANTVIYTGGQYDSYLQIPVIPPRYQVGDYIVR